MTQIPVLAEGRPAPLGATFDGEGVNFAVFSEHAKRMTVCLFSPDGKTELHRLDLPEREGDVWHGYIAGLRPGQLYALRADGPYAPEEGHRFNYNKLLLDPYAKRLTGHPEWNDALMGYTVGAKTGDLSFDTRDSAPYMPRCVVEDPSFNWGRRQRPRTTLARSVIYEAHVKGLTQLHPNVETEGGFLALASDAMLDHMTRLGITAIELLPVQAFLNDRFLVEKGLTNYWGYQTLGFFAPDPRFMTQDGIHEFQHMVARLHGAGIEVILDVVYNHTCEGSELGPTLSFRGLDNASYYRLAEDKRHCINDTGTGNTVNMDHPMVMRMVMDSLRYWVQVMHVDGFRFDLCASLGRVDNNGFDRNAAFFQALRQDPVLTGVKLIAEPWDIGPGGYQLGGFPPPFAEWNDKYRDDVRKFWRGDDGMVPDLAERLTGSAVQFDHSGRFATSSVNLITAHDGYTLADTTAYLERHNEANGEDNNDGHDSNYSDNFGVEGPTDDPDILSARSKRRRNMLATLLLSQGTPMILAGDELGNSQGGNNNAYCQDNEVGWVDWANADTDLMIFTQKLIGFRKAHPIMRQKRFLHARERLVDGIEDLFWWRSDGQEMQEADWNDPALRVLCAEMRTASGTPRYAVREEAILLAFNSGDALDLILPEPPRTKAWVLYIDTAQPKRDAEVIREGKLKMAAESTLALVLERMDG
ncbi:glycogen debranching protein GlgX [Puniceibacterium sp. IMCC21224]|uniref:glycogen debranching protein GlgX n=1 Tax=Puniceibacterium sp. IMCC21224 TaxID=1618204 RepID=UPI00064DA2FD|nr:glycogen debranching protein GlgX [Puniceibacterium sp. IMCC21224]KMK67437.1 glycogen debranching enzyme GlgX [Puniceibacterium sp. IMCC21224]